MSNEEIEKIKKQLVELENLKDQYLKEWQRARADLINYKKEERERINEVVERTKESLIFDFLPILDNFEMAEKAISSESKENSHLRGLLQIKIQIIEFLKKNGLEEIKTLGEKFDPLFHEIVGEVETEEKESGTIVEEIQKGYKIKGKVLRPAKVKVAK